jgi:hypothetical protein
MTSPDEFRTAVDEAFASGGSVPVGDLVLCDIDDTDLTADARSGGYMFGSYAVGPCCAAAHEARVRGYGEEWNIRARCPEGVPFADWVRGMRGPDAAVTVTRFRAGGAS